MNTIQVIPEGFGIQIFNKLKAHTDQLRSKKQMSKYLKSGKLYVHCVGDRDAPTAMVLRIWN